MTVRGGTGLSEQVAADLQSYRSGDPHAMADLTARVTPLLWHVARGYRLSSASAEDVVQNTLLAFVRHAERIAEPQATLGWLVVTARREALRMARAEQRTDLVPEPAAATPDAEARRPDLVVLASNERAVLWRNIRLLSQRCQLLLRVIAFAERPDYEALSEVLGMPVGSIGPTRGRCLAKLRALLAADPEWEPA